MDLPHSTQNLVAAVDEGALAALLPNGGAAGGALGALPVPL